MKNIKKVITNLGNKAITLAKVHGPAFLGYAIIVNFLDEIVIPGILVYFGFPVLGGAMVLGDLDWLTYPLYFLFKGALKSR